MALNLEAYRLIIVDLASVLYREDGRFQMLPPVREWLAQQPLRAPDQIPFIVVVEYLPIAIRSTYRPLASALTRNLPVDGAKSLFGRWPDPAALRLCQRLYGVPGGLLLGNSHLHLIAAQDAGLDFCYVQALFPSVKQVQAGDETAVWCPTCGPGTLLSVGGKQADRLVCRICGYSKEAPSSLALLNSGALRLL